MSWLARIAADTWAKLAALAALAGTLLFLVARIHRAGRDAERAGAGKAAHDHQQETASKVSRSDEALDDPETNRARRVRRRFERQD